MRVVELFCGAGGMSLGLKRAGFDVAAAYDSWPAAMAVYRENHPEQKTMLRPLRIPRNRARGPKVADVGDLLELVPTLLDLDADMIAGGPPCQDFSKAGKRVEGTRADMTLAFAALIAVARPQWVLMENVKEVTNSKAWQRARAILKRSGYGLSEMLLDAAQHGVGQQRVRFILVGRLGEEDGFLNDVLELPKKAPRTTVRDVLGDDVGVHPGPGYPEEARAYYLRTYRNRRAVWSIDEPCKTITRKAGYRNGEHTPHPSDTTDASRAPLLTWEQLAMLQGFPPGWKWGEAKGDRNLMVANAVPAPLAEAIGRAILARHRGDTIPEIEGKFVKWLKAKKGYSGPVLRNRVSQVRRARRLLKGRILADPDQEQALLQRTKKFMALGTTVRSDLLSALALHAEWRNPPVPFDPDVPESFDDEDDRDWRATPSKTGETEVEELDERQEQSPAKLRSLIERLQRRAAVATE